MDYAFSLVKLETMSVEEFLQLEGDDGWLIGKNMIICSECSANVFLRRGEKKAPHFAHSKFKEGNEGCTKRVGKYTPDKVRQMRIKQSKYRVGYFQQRFEDYLFISLLDMIKQSNLFYVDWGRNSGKNSTPIIGLEKIEDSMYAEKIQHLRNIGNTITAFLVKKSKKNRGARDLGEAAQYWLDLNKMHFNEYGSDEYKNNIRTAIKYEGTHSEKSGLKTELQGEMSSIKFDFRDGDEIFAAEAMTHLLQKGAEPLVGAAMAAAMEFHLSTTLSKVWREHAIGVFEVNKYGMGSNFLSKYLTDNSKVLSTRFTTARLLRAWLDLCEDAFDRKYSQQLLDWENQLMLIGASYYEGWAGTGPKKGADYPYYVETYSLIARLFKFINFAATAQSFYGDSSDSAEETRRKSINSERGYIYIAWAPYLKDIWQVDLKKNGFADCVKIGYSDDPDRRKKEIAGNIGPPDSIEIIDVWPMLDMKSAEAIVHRKLKRYRLSPDRELFGLDIESAKKNVGKILDESFGPSVSKRGKATGFS